MYYFNHTLGTTVPAENIVMDCKIQGEQFKMTMDTVSECLHSSCNAAEYGETMANLNSDPEMNDLLASLGADCTFNSAYHLRLGAGMFAFVVTAALFL